MGRCTARAGLIGVVLFGVALSSAALEVNQASQAELERLRGIGPALSQQLVEQRERRAFTDWADLRKRVHGIGEATARRLSAAGLTVDARSIDQPLPAAATPASSPR